MDWNKLAEEYLRVAHEVCSGLQPEIEQAASRLADALRAGRKVMACGNGGSAADAQHFAAELVNRFQMERRPYAGLALTTDSSCLTSIANDYSYAEVFAKQVRALGQPGDVLLAISTSGNAESVCRAVEAANEMGLWTLALTGGTGGRLAAVAQARLCVGSVKVTARIQEGHLLIIHALCGRLEEILR